MRVRETQKTYLKGLVFKVYSYNSYILTVQSLDFKRCDYNINIVYFRTVKPNFFFFCLQHHRNKLQVFCILFTSLVLTCISIQMTMAKFYVYLEKKKKAFKNKEREALFYKISFGHTQVPFYFIPSKMRVKVCDKSRCRNPGFCNVWKANFKARQKKTSSLQFLFSQNKEAHFKH